MALSFVIFSSQVLTAYPFPYTPPASEIRYAPNQLIAFTKGIGRARADTLGRGLQKIGVFDNGRPVNIVMSPRFGGGIELSFFVPFESWNHPWSNPFREGRFHDLSAYLADTVLPGQIVLIQLCARHKASQKIYPQ